MKKLIPLLLVIVVLIVMALSNPTKDEYGAWYAEYLSTTARNDFEKGLISLFGNYFIKAETTTKSYVFFSIFTTSYDKQVHTTVGVFDNFILISK